MKRAIFLFDRHASTSRTTTTTLLNIVITITMSLLLSASMTRAFRPVAAATTRRRYAAQSVAWSSSSSSSTFIHYPHISSMTTTTTMTKKNNHHRSLRLMSPRGRAMSSSSSSSVEQQQQPSRQKQQQSQSEQQKQSQSRLFPEELNILYDSQCNVCKLEIDFLRHRDQKVNAAQRKLRFTDLEGETGALFDPSDPANGGVSYATGMANMHGVTHDGQVLSGVPVFRQAYQAVGLGFLFRVTRIPMVAWLADRLYDIFAKYRTYLTRGTSVERLVQAYEAKRQLESSKQQAARDCDDGSCAVKKSS